MCGCGLYGPDWKCGYHVEMARRDRVFADAINERDYTRAMAALGPGAFEGRGGLLRLTMIVTTVLAVSKRDERRERFAAWWNNHQNTLDT